jgi:hypothetical protein
MRMLIIQTGDPSIKCVPGTTSDEIRDDETCKGGHGVDILRIIVRDEISE